MMHHCGECCLHGQFEATDSSKGMWAMIIPRGRITWNLGIVALSYIVAFVVCLVASTTMEHMEVHLARQVAFSTFAALGVCCMHYMGAHAASLYRMTLLTL